VYEQTITQGYLEQLNQLYDSWASGFRLCPVLTVNTDNLNYVQHEEHLDQIWARIQNRLQGQEYLALE
jgi:deoxyadenosine/deoxycytidine kinase